MIPNEITQGQYSVPELGKVDNRWREKYSHSLWFQLTPRQLAALYTDRHLLTNML